MKKFYTLLLVLVASLSFAQMTISTSGTTVTFTYNLDPATWNSAPVYLYCYVDVNDASPALASTAVLAPWPGQMMTGSGTGPYTISYDLMNAMPSIPVGTTVKNIKYIYNDNAGNQNPGSGAPGFDANALSGWSDIMITVSGVNDIENPSAKSAIVNGKLYTPKKGDLQIEIFDVTGKSIQSQNVKADGSAIDLQLTTSGIFLLRLSDGKSVETVKFKN